MKAVVRPLKDTDSREDLARLRTVVRPHSPEARDDAWQSSVWGWLEGHPLAGEMHRWVLDAGGEIVGHLAALPQSYRIGGRRVVAHAPADYMVLPAYGFHAITLMRKFFRSCENCVVCDSAPTVIGIETKLGAKVAGELQAGAKLWNVSRLPGFPTWIPRPAARLPNLGLRAVDRALNDTAFRGLRVDVLDDGFDAAFDELFEKVAAAVPCVPEKNAAFLRWRYGPGSPQHPVTVLGVRNGGALLGYAVLRTTRGDDGYLLDLTALPGRLDVAQALLMNSVQRLRRQRAHSVRYRFVQSPTSPRIRDLRRLGFFVGSERPTSLLVKLGEKDLHDVAGDAARWSYSFGDGEGSFWIK